ncbi:MAG: TonB-dependent receptor [Candidatus Solibacter usitatus]|nr:TonB-dependent receptor [Candidatus Solibacter usitatus]
MKLVALLAPVLFLFAPALRAQQTTATFYAVVADSTGGSIPSAVVTLTHEGTGSAVNRTTSALGEAAFDYLRVGSYSLRIEAKGFKRLESKGIELSAAQNIRQTYVLEVGATTETVNVEGSTTLINTVSSEQLNTFDTSKIMELPIFRRNYTNLLALNSGVTMAAEGVRMNGIGKNGVSYTVDGTDAGGNPEGRYSSNYLQPNLIDIMSIEAIQEVHTIKGVPPAEYGNMVAGQVNLLSKSGTNRFHGSLFENFRAENLDARHQRLANKPGLTFNQFGGSFGGPIKRDRIFVFGVYEGYRDRAFTLVQETLMTARLRDEALRVTPSYKLYLDFIPLPNQPVSPTADTGLYINPTSSRRDDNHADLKGDIRLGQSSTLSVSYTRGRPTQLQPRHYLKGANDRLFRIWDERGTANYVTGGSNWTSESRFGYHLTDMHREDAFFFTQFDPENKNEKVPFGRRIPRLSYPGVANPDQELYLMEGRSYNFDQKYSRHAGKQSLKFGFTLRRDCCRRNNPEAVNIAYSTRADFINNVTNSVGPTYGNGDYTAKMYQLGGFAQTDWRVRSDLTLNLGIRYDYFSHLVPEANAKAPLTGIYNPDGLRDANFNVGPIRPRDNPYESDKWANLGPRFGFAYNVGGKSKTVLRGGFGMLFSGQVAGAMWAHVQPTPTAPFRFNFIRADSTRLGIRWPTYNDDLIRIIESESAARGWINTFSVVNPKLQNPYTMHFTFGFQRQITNSLALESAFVGTRGVKFLMQRWMNEPDRTTGLRPNPRLNVNYYVDESQQTAYLSWQTSLRKRFSHGLSGSAHYTWGKGLSTAGGDIGAYYQGDADARTQDFFNIRADRGPNTGDITHYFNSEWVYQIPQIRSLQNTAARHILGGWQVSGILLARTGNAVQLSQTGTGLNVSRPDFVGGQAIFGDYRQTLRYLNPAAFALVPINPTSRITVRPGNVGNNALRDPGAWNVNFAMNKEFPIAERARIRVGVDGFNFFNHTNLSGLVTNINNVFFGQLQGTGGARLVQLNARVTW